MGITLSPYMVTKVQSFFLFPCLGDSGMKGKCGCDGLFY